MDGVDSIDALVNAQWIDVLGKKWNWPQYISTVDVPKSVAFKVFKVINPM